MPFPTALMGAHSTPGDHFAVVFYAASMTLASLALTSTWLHARRAGLLDQSLDRETATYLTTRTVFTTALFLASVGAAFLGGLRVAILFWLLLLPAARLLLARRRGFTPEQAGQSSATRSR
jgi:TMEM175 potassium channel family protein